MTLQTLPNDVLLLIFKHLNSRQRARLAVLCKGMRAALRGTWESFRMLPDPLVSSQSLISWLDGHASGSRDIMRELQLQMRYSRLIPNTCKLLFYCISTLGSGFFFFYCKSSCHGFHCTNPKCSYDIVLTQLSKLSLLLVTCLLERVNVKLLLQSIC